MAGGHATVGGVMFQCEVAAHLAVHVLTAHPFDLVGSAWPVSLYLEGPSPVDDIVVSASDGGTWYFNVKTEVSLSSLDTSELSSVIDQFVRQWLAGCIEPSTSENNAPSASRPLSSVKDRLVLAVRAGRSRTLLEGLKLPLQRLRDSDGQLSVASLSQTQAERGALATLVAHIKRHWFRHSGMELSDEQLSKLLASLRLVEFDLTGPSRSAIATLLTRVVAPSDASRAITDLVQICTEYATNRSGGGGSELRARLRLAGISLKADPQYEQDVKRLSVLTERTLADLSRYGYIGVGDDGKRVQIKRRCAEAMVEHAAVKSFLVIGEPGSGKSGALHALASRLQEIGTPVVVLAVDQLLGQTVEQLGNELGVTNPIVDVLAQWESSQHPVLIIDALDACRGSGAEGAIQNLLKLVRRDAPRWRVVASIRKFDLRYGRNYQGLFDGRPLSTEFSDTEFARIAHINVPLLSDAEVDDIRDQWPQLDSVAKGSSSRFLELLRSPFNLFLLGRIVQNSTDAVNVVHTQMDLLKEYWHHRVEIGNFAEVQRSTATLSEIVDRMLSERRLAVQVTELAPHRLSEVQRLLEAGVLHQPGGSNGLGYAHHMLFDFALAKLKYFKSGANSIAAEVADSSEDVMLIAPAVVLALRLAWELAPNRQSFWKVSLEIAGAADVGSFLKALPAKVAVESAHAAVDLQPLQNAIKDESRRDPAIFLVRHVLQVLLAGVVPAVPRLGDDDDPWCEVIRGFAESALDALLWPLNAVVSTWTDKELGSKQKVALGVASRRLLESELKMPSSDGVARAGIQGVVRTFETAPLESETLIRGLFEAHRMSVSGHRDLFWLAGEFRRLATRNPRLAADFIVAVFNAELPEAEQTQIGGGGRILSLLSDKRQDFKGVIHYLERNLKWFVIAFPHHAANACRAVIDHTVNERRLGDADRTYAVAIDDRIVQFRQDYSCVWWREEEERHEEGAGAVLSALHEALKEMAEQRNDQAFETLAATLLAGTVWAATVALFLRVLRDAPSHDGLAAELLSSSDVLDAMDTEYLAGELLRRAYIRFTDVQKTRVDDAILEVTDVRRQAVLVGCIPLESIQTEALREIREAAGGAHPENTPNFSMQTRWGEEVPRGWLKDSGADIDDPKVKELLDLADTLEFDNLPPDTEAALQLLRGKWSTAKTVKNLVDAFDDLNEEVGNQAAGRIGKLCEAIAGAAQQETDLSEFDGLLTIINWCLRGQFRPVAIRDDKEEEQFEKFAAWGAPAPRVDAAGALMTLIRAKGSATEEEAALVVSLARDPAVAVRHTVLARANAVCNASPVLAHELAKIALEEETNGGVIAFFLGALQKYLAQEMPWAINAVLALEAKRRPWPSDRSAGGLLPQLVSLILRFWIGWDNAEAGGHLRSWTEDPVGFAPQIDELLGDLRELVVFGDELGNTNHDSKRKKSLILFEATVSSLASAHKSLLVRAQRGEEVREVLTECTRLLDRAAHHLYFGSGAYALSHADVSSAGPATSAVRKRFLDEYLPTLATLAAVPYPSVTHPVLETVEALISDGPEETLQLLVSTVAQGGKGGGYQFESMGADLVVRIAKRFIADYSALLSSKPEYRHGLMETLNLFAESGSGEARKLAYELPEMLR
jgi:hypothetical protein